MQGTQVQSQVWEDPIWYGATKPVCCNCRETHEPQGGSHVLQQDPTAK